MRAEEADRLRKNIVFERERNQGKDIQGEERRSRVKRCLVTKAAAFP